MEPITSTILLIASLAATALGTGHSIASNAVKNDRADLTRDEAQTALDHLNLNYQLALSNNPYWNSLSNSEKLSILREYNLGEDMDGIENVDFDKLITDLGEYAAINELGAEPRLQDYANFNLIQNKAQAAIDAENEKLLASLNEDLQASGEAYNTARNAMLTQQHQHNAQTIDTLASEMSRARRNAIEAGASAGIRIASNVNTILSAQNKMSQESLNTSNQLAQMLVNQRNAEAGLRDQWRDAQMSTYGRVQDRTASEMNIGQQRYQQAHEIWQDEYDDAVSETNALGSRMLKHSQKTKY